MKSKIIKLLNSKINPEYKAKLEYDEYADLNYILIEDEENSDILDCFVLDYIIKGIRTEDEKLIVNIIENSFAYKLLKD
jgi:hypothetical protein